MINFLLKLFGKNKIDSDLIIEAEEYNKLGVKAGKLENYDDALMFFTKAIATSHNYASPYINRGIAYNKLQDFSSAIQDFTIGIEIEPNNAETYYNRGLSYNYLQEYSKSISDYTKAIELNSNYAGAFYFRGLTYNKLMDLTKAIEDYDKAIEIDPSLATVYFFRGLAHKQIGNANKACEDMRKAYSLGEKQAKGFIDEYCKSNIYDQNNENTFDNNEDNNIYNSVKIGTQEWTAENLNVDHYRNGDVIPQVQDEEEWTKLSTGAWCYYENNSENGETYGKLYNWYAINDPRGLAPEGWHIPSDIEWTLLTEFLGGVTEEDILEDGTKYWYIKSVGGQLKATELWDIPNVGATNSTEFAALPGGIRFADGSFLYIEKFSYFWSSSDVNYDLAWGRYLNYGGSDVGCSHGYKVIGLSVRCVKD